MLWSYSGDMTIHSADGWDVEHVDGVFDLPDHNVELIRNFLYANRDFILKCKYQPQSGVVPWGDNQSQAAMRSELSRKMPDEQWLDGVTDRQVKSYLVAFYHHMLKNIDLYSPAPLSDREVVAA